LHPIASLVTDQRDQESEHAISRPSAAPATSAPIDEASRRAIEGSTVIRLQGHLFDTGLINAALDVVEAAGAAALLAGAGGANLIVARRMVCSLLLHPRHRIPGV
jgi:hypothetical protein